jgi:hypothetical protein
VLISLPRWLRCVNLNRFQSYISVTLITVVCHLLRLWDTTSMADEWLRMEHFWSDTDRRENEVIEEKPLPTTICAPQISHGLAWDWTRASVVTAQRAFAFLIFMDKYRARIRFGVCLCLSCNKFVKWRVSISGGLGGGVLLGLICHGFKIFTLVNVVGKQGVVR